MPVCGNYLFFELPKKIVLNPKDGRRLMSVRRADCLSDDFCIDRKRGLFDHCGDSPQVRPAHPAHLSDAAPDDRSDHGGIYRGANRGRHRGTLHRNDFCGTVQKSPAQAR